MVSGLGGVALESVEETLLVIPPLLILLPALNDSIGSIGTVTSSRFTSILYLKGEVTHVWQEEEVRRLLRDVGITAATAAIYIGVLSAGVAYLRGHSITLVTAGKVVMTAVGSTMILFTVIFAAAVMGGLYFYRRGKDPDNFLIPITTSIADIANLAVFAGFVWLLF